jgi:hypothetical protein
MLGSLKSLLKIPSSDTYWAGGCSAGGADDWYLLFGQLDFSTGVMANAHVFKTSIGSEYNLNSNYQCIDRMLLGSGVIFATTSSVLKSESLANISILVLIMNLEETYLDSYTISGTLGTEYI